MVYPNPVPIPSGSNGCSPAGNTFEIASQGKGVSEPSDHQALEQSKASTYLDAEYPRSSKFDEVLQKLHWLKTIFSDEAFDFEKVGLE